MIKKIFIISIIVLGLVAPASAGFFDFLFPPAVQEQPTGPAIEDLSMVNETETITYEDGFTKNIVYEGITIKNKSKSLDKQYVVRKETEKKLKDVTFPYTYQGITIEKWRCTDDNLCGYWITATRNGQEVATDSPIWIRNPPYRVIVSENETTLVLKEDPFGAIKEILQRYSDNQPLGKGKVGTPA